jgi:hypothetical protein
MNIHNLPRDIPEHVKREVRRRNGFGCVLCGECMVDYEHVDPEYREAKEHNPDCITLLCPGCHAKVTRKIYAKARVKLAMRAPWCLREGFAWSDMDPGTEAPYLLLAGNRLVRCAIPVQVRDLPLFQVEAPEEAGGPYRFSAHFFDGSGRRNLSIYRNEWTAYTSSWDVKTAGGRLTIRSSPNDVSLQLKFDPGQGVIVEKLDMWCYGYRFIGDKDSLKFVAPDGGEMTLTNCLMDNCQVGIQLG